MKVSIGDFRKNMKKYLDMLEETPIYLTKHGRVEAVIRKE